MRVSVSGSCVVMVWALNPCCQDGASSSSRNSRRKTRSSVSIPTTEVAERVENKGDKPRAQEGSHVECYKVGAGGGIRRALLTAMMRCCGGVVEVLL